MQIREQLEQVIDTAIAAACQDGSLAMEEPPAARQERGFVLVWPAKGESRWETAKRLRVAEEELHPAGKGAMLAFRK